MGKVKKNFVYNLIYQILILVIPLITAPYLARTVKASRCWNLFVYIFYCVLFYAANIVGG